MSEDWDSGSSTTASTGFGFGRGKTWGVGSDGDSAFAEKRPGGGFNNNNSGGSNGWNESSSSGFGAKSNGFGGGSGGGSGGFGTGFGSGSGGDSFSGSGFGGGGGAEKKFGGGGGGGGRACFKCGEDGHMSRECPKGGGGGGGGSRACFKCGEDGHMSRECPKSGGGGGGGGKGCFKCGQEGHMSRECPSGGGGGGGGGGGRACFKCGEDGHMSRECPKSGGGGGGGGRACFKCNQEGHMSRECPNAGSGGGFGSRDGGTSTGGFGSTSSGGGGFGSTSSGGGGFGTSSGGGGFGTSSGGGGFGTSSGGGGGFGTSSGGGGGFSGGSGDGAFGKSSGGFGKSSGGEDTGFGSGGGGGRGGFGGSSRGGMSGSGGKGCFKCGEEGHMSRECPNAESGGGGGGGGSGGKGCFKCGEEGHVSRECPNAGSGRSGGGGGGKCFKCQGEGHMARECPNAPPEDPDRPKTERYIPPEDDNEEAAIVHAGINFDKYDDIPVEMSGNNKIQPIASFDEAGLYDMCRANVLSKMKYTKPTPVQKWAIPAILQHRDLMACAQTGSGKTGAFLLPVITNMISERLISSASSEVQEPQCVVVAPTRELATQIQKEAQKFASGTILRSVVIYGGTSVGHQAMQVRKGTHLLVATPGRLMDFVDKGIVSLSKVKYLVLDEAAQMFDMGFEPVIRDLAMYRTMPPKGERVTLMFSATFPDEIQRLAADFLHDYLFLRVGPVGRTNTDVTQTVHEVTKYHKRTELCKLLQSTNSTDRTLVFVKTQLNADILACYLAQSGYPTTSIHGARFQREREEALRDFKSGKASVLVATAVAARGLDINDVKHVVNYDLPEHIEEYVHRIGRTGRRGNIGRATTFYDPQYDGRLARALVKVLADAQQKVPEWLESEAVAQDRIGPGADGGTDVRRGGGRVDGVLERAGDHWGGGVYDGWAHAQTSCLNRLADDADESWD